METFSANYGADRVRKATLQGREYLVAPVSLIVPGVLNGSRGPLYYPVDEVAKDPTIWNGVPIVVYHPQVEGQHVSARDPDILANQGIGQVLRAKFNGKKLVGEGWFDIEATRRVDNRIYQALMEGKPIELSTGLFTENEEMNGVYNGRPYTHIARNYKADHLAVFADMVGACSLRDGCGVLINSESPPLWSKLIQNNCGIGSGGFKSGNSCAKGGGGSTSSPKTYEEAKAGVEAAKARFKKASVGGSGFDHDEFLNSRKDLETARKQAAQLKPKGKSSSSKTVKSKAEKVSGSDVPVSFTAHDGGTRLSQKQATKVLKLDGVQPSAYGSGGPRGAAGVKTRHGHDEDALMVSRSHAGKVRTSLEADGWKHTHTQNIESISGGKNHQEVLKKGQYTVTTVDYGYGDVTIQVSKSSKKAVNNSATPQETPVWTRVLLYNAAKKAGKGKSSSGGRWITISGTHVLVDGSGNIKKGPKALKSASGSKGSKGEKSVEKRTSLTEKKGNDWSGSAPAKAVKAKKWSKKNTEGIKEGLSGVKLRRSKSKKSPPTPPNEVSQTRRSPKHNVPEAGKGPSKQAQRTRGDQPLQPPSGSKKTVKAALSKVPSKRYKATPAELKKSRESTKDLVEIQKAKAGPKGSKVTKPPRKGQGTGKFTKEQKAGMDLASKLSKQGAESFARGKSDKKESFGTRLKKSAKKKASDLVQRALSKIKSGVRKVKKRLTGNEEQVENTWSPAARAAAAAARRRGKKPLLKKVDVGTPSAGPSPKRSARLVGAEIAKIRSKRSSGNFGASFGLVKKKGVVGAHVRQEDNHISATRDSKHLRSLLTKHGIPVHNVSVVNVFSEEAREAARLAREQGKKRAAGKINKLRQQRMAERKAKPRTELARKGDVIRKKQATEKGMTLEERKSRAAEANKRTLERYGRRPLAANHAWARLVVNHSSVDNMFCATGPGGGQDPHCGKGGKKGTIKKKVAEPDYGKVLHDHSIKPDGTRSWSRQGVQGSGAHGAFETRLKKLEEHGFTKGVESTSGHAMTGKTRTIEYSHPSGVKATATHTSQWKDMLGDHHTVSIDIKPKVKASRKKLTGNRTSGERLMKLKPEAKERIIGDLIANTGVGVVGPWEESDRVALVELPDEKLKHMDNVRKETAAKVTANKAVSTSTAGQALEVKDVEVTIEGKQYALNAATGNYELKKTPTGNCGGHTATANDKPMTEKDWMDKAPPRVRAAVTNAMKLEDDEKERLISHIVSNIEDEKVRQEKGLKYMEKSLDELQEIYDLIPQKQVTGNTEVARPRYFGHGVNPVTPSKPVFNAQDKIEEIEIDWTEVSKANANQRQTA